MIYDGRVERFTHTLGHPPAPLVAQHSKKPVEELHVICTGNGSGGRSRQHAVPGAGITMINENLIRMVSSLIPPAFAHLLTQWLNALDITLILMEAGMSVTVVSI